MNFAKYLLDQVGHWSCVVILNQHHSIAAQVLRVTHYRHALRGPACKRCTLLYAMAVNEIGESAMMGISLPRRI